ncbi:MAG: MFS transporter [Gemmatimonadaceae bacterium]
MSNPTSEKPSPPLWRPSRNLLALSIVSLLTDASSEIIAPLLPLFLVGTLGATATFVGTIEGAAETIATLMKLVSGWWSDRVKRRKPLIVIGYTIASLVRPFVALATSAGQVLAIRSIDRVGKGLRGAPRDALIAASMPPELRGRAFGFHRAFDHAGAVIGPLIAMLCLQALGMPLRHVFWVAAIPGALAVFVAVFAVREERVEPASVVVPPAVVSQEVIAPAVVATAVAENSEAFTAGTERNETRTSESLGAPFWRTMIVIVLFTLGNSTDAFLLLRASQLGVTVAAIPLLWIVLHLVKMFSSTPGGRLSDHIGRRPLIVSGWTLYAFVYLGFAFANVQWHAWILFAVYGVVFGLTEGTEKALVADLVTPGRRGAAFGWYGAAVGIAALPASVLFGVVWDRFGSSHAFAMGAGIAIAAATMFVAIVPRVNTLQFGSESA